MLISLGVQTTKRTEHSNKDHLRIILVNVEYTQACACGSLGDITTPVSGEMRPRKSIRRSSERPRYERLDL